MRQERYISILRSVKKNGETIAVNASVTPVKWGGGSYLFIAARKTSGSLLC